MPKRAPRVSGVTANIVALPLPGMTTSFPVPRNPDKVIQDALVAAGRLGQKNGKRLRWTDESRSRVAPAAGGPQPGGGAPQPLVSVLGPRCGGARSRLVDRSLQYPGGRGRERPDDVTAVASPIVARELPPYALR